MTPGNNSILQELFINKRPEKFVKVWVNCHGIFLPRWYVLYMFWHFLLHSFLCLMLVHCFLEYFSDSGCHISWYPPTHSNYINGFHTTLQRNRIILSIMSFRIKYLPVTLLKHMQSFLNCCLCYYDYFSSPDAIFFYYLLQLIERLQTLKYSYILLWPK